MKYHYRVHLSRALRKDEKTYIAALKHIRDFELFTGFAGFETFNEQVAHHYLNHLFERNISTSYIHDNVRTVREFFGWLERQKGYRSKLNYNHITYLNLSHNQQRTARASAYKKAYSLEQILATIRNMPANTLTEQRNKAMISLQALCGLRVSELRTVRMGSLIQEDGHYFIYVNPKEMSVKFAKIRQANFMPLPADIAQNVLAWHEALSKRGFKPRDPLFPKISNLFGQSNMLNTTLTHEEIRSSTCIRGIFKTAFEAAGYEYLRPHSFRHTITRWAAKQSPEFLNAVRHSLGHSSIETTSQSYGTLSEYDQRRLIGKPTIAHNPQSV